MRLVSDYRTKKVRSPNYPGISLPAAIERAETLYERESRHAAPVPAVLAHWGYSPKSGPGFSALAAVKQFGLIDDEGRGDDRRVKLSELGLRIVQDRRPGSVEREDAIREAALRPAVYSELWGRFGLAASDENITYALVKMGFSENAAHDVVEGYRATVSFAQLSEDATIRTDAEEATGGNGDPPPAIDPSLATRDQQRGRTMSDSVVYAIPVAAGADVKVEGRFPLSEPQWGQFMAVLTAMKPALVAETEPQGDDDD